MEDSQNGEHGRPASLAAAGVPRPSVPDNLIREGGTFWPIPPWLWPLALSFAAWSTIWISIPPARQQFPLGDDWAFARGAMWFAQGHGIHYSRWASIPQLGQWLWSLPFLWGMGSSHFALRLSTIVLSWLGLVSFYDLLRREGVTPRVAGFAGCVLAANPLFFVSQGTYMTDVPALAFALMALNCYERALAGRPAHLWLALAAALAVLGEATRQVLILVPVVAAFMAARRPELRFRPRWLAATLLPIAAGLLLNRWFAHRSDVILMSPKLPSPDTLMLLPFLILHTCGLTILPFAALAFRPPSWPVFALALSVTAALAIFWFVLGDDLLYGGMFPYCGGMLSLCGTYSENLVVGTREILLTPWIRMTFSILGCLGGAVLLVAVADSIRSRTRLSALVLFTVLQALILAVLPSFWDRYLEVLFPGALCLVAVHCKDARPRWWPGAATVMLSAVLSVGLVHDWLSWNSARWELGEQARARGIPAADIEGGFEWDGWYACADPDRPMPLPNPNASADDAASLALPFTRLFFPQVTGRYALGFTQPPNSCVVARKRYAVWLWPGSREFLFLRHVEQPPLPVER